MSEAGSGEDGGDEEGCFVADAAGGVLVDGEGVESGVASNVSPEKRMAAVRVASSSCVEPAQEDGHEEGCDLGVGDELLFSVCGRRWRERRLGSLRR